MLFSYSSWDQLNGFHGDSNVVKGLARFSYDFGLAKVSGDGVEKFENTVDGYTRVVDGTIGGIGIYGEKNKCAQNSSCKLIMILDTSRMLEIFY